MAEPIHTLRRLRATFLVNQLKLRQHNQAPHQVLHPGLPWSVAYNILRQLNLLNGWPAA